MDHSCGGHHCTQEATAAAATEVALAAAEAVVTAAEGSDACRAAMSCAEWHRLRVDRLCLAVCVACFVGPCAGFAGPALCIRALCGNLVCGEERVLVYDTMCGCCQECELSGVGSKFELPSSRALFKTP